MAQQLGLSVDSDLAIESDNVVIRAAGNKENFSYTWYRVLWPHKKDIEYDDHEFFSPNKDNTDMVIEYVVIKNGVESKAWLVSVELLTENAMTYRGLKIGDEEQTFLDKYGNGYEAQSDTKSSNYYRLELAGDGTLNNPSKYLSIVFDKTKGEISKINIIYSKDETMDFLDIVAFD
jgi:hypothetical protein